MQRSQKESEVAAQGKSGQHQGGAVFRGRRRTASRSLSSHEHRVQKLVRGKQSVAESYSVNIPGATPDGALHLVERTTRAQRTGSVGEHITEERVEQPNPGDPTCGLGLSVCDGTRDAKGTLESLRWIRRTRIKLSPFRYREPFRKAEIKSSHRSGAFLPS
jgi:hypothetical protein